MHGRSTILAILMVALLAGCATQPILYEERQTDGSYVKVKTNRIVPFGGVDDAQQSATIGVDEKGSYTVSLGGAASTDLTRTGDALAAGWGQFLTVFGQQAQQVGTLQMQLNATQDYARNLENQVKQLQIQYQKLQQAQTPLPPSDGD